MADATNSYAEIGVNDRRALLGDDDANGGRARRCRAFCSSHKWCFIIATALALIVLGHAIAVYVIYFRCNLYMGNCAVLKVMALNTWGMPAAFGSVDKPQRMDAIAAEIGKGHYDLYLLTELWMQPDHENIASKIPEGYHMTGFRELALSTCDGRVSPAACSGLAIVSKYPFNHTEFNSYTFHGDWTKATIDGEWLARKGVGLVRIEPLKGVSMDVFVTHTAADPDPSHNYTNEYYRIRQVEELMTHYEEKATSDVVLLGGDFNAGPINEPGHEYYLIRQKMRNTIEEFLYKLRAWLDPAWATYGNRKNTFSNNYTPVIYDYVFYHVNDASLKVWTSFFEMPFFKTLLHTAVAEEEEEEAEAEGKDSGEEEEVEKKEKEISFSDHEAITTTIYVWK